MTTEPKQTEIQVLLTIRPDSDSQAPLEEVREFFEGGGADLLDSSYFIRLDGQAAPNDLAWYTVEKVAVTAITDDALPVPDAP